MRPSATKPCCVDLVRQADGSGAGLETYLRHMMRVMDFDLRRRGRLVTEAELNDYTKLARDRGDRSHALLHRPWRLVRPRSETRYMAASGAHILHMLRDTFVDLRAGYWNVPGRCSRPHSIEPEDVPQRRVSSLGRSAASGWHPRSSSPEGPTSPASRVFATAWPASPTSPASSGWSRRSKRDDFRLARDYSRRRLRDGPCG